MANAASRLFSLEFLTLKWETSTGATHKVGLPAVTVGPVSAAPSLDSTRTRILDLVQFRVWTRTLEEICQRAVANQKSPTALRVANHSHELTTAALFK